MRDGARSLLLAVATAVLASLLVGCGQDQPQGGNADPEQVDSVEAPKLGACRGLTPDDIAAASNATETVECTEDHTAQTYAVGQLPDELEDTDYDSRDLGRFAYRTCSTKLQKFLGADESLSLRTVLTWAWFRPSEKAWDDGARWYRCDVVGGTEKSEKLLPLPETAQGLLGGRPDDRWLVCVQGPTVSTGVKVPCSRPHDWRAVTTIKVGEAGEKYPGDRVVEVTTRDFCSKSVGAWLNYPVDFDFGYTWFHEPEWDAGNRRSVCWAKTPD